MRISERHRYWIANNRINKSKEDNVSTLEKLSTQKRINKLSDDPVGAMRALKITDQLSEIADYKKNIDFSKGFLDVTESAIAGVQEGVSRAHELAIGMANGVYSGEDMKITAKEIKEIMTGVMQTANSTYGGKYVFSGFRHDAPALSPDGDFLGDDGQIFLQVGAKLFKRINIPGRELFEANFEEKKAGHFNLIDTMDILLQGLEGGQKELVYKAVDELNYQSNKLSSYQASVGAIWSSLEEAGKKMEFDESQGTAFRSEIVDADIFKATSDFKRSETVLQSTLLASNKMLQPSLLNFMQ